jgi:hypothetical protein
MVLTGCVDASSHSEKLWATEMLTAYPVPTEGLVNISLPDSGTGGTYSYSVLSSNGQVVSTGTFRSSGSTYLFNLSEVQPGVYHILLTGSTGTVYRIKVVKN